MERAIVCALDPGREKFGLAVAGEALLFSAIVPIERAEEAARALASGRWSALTPWERERRVAPTALDEIGAAGRGRALLVGDGTGSEALRETLIGAGLRCVAADERGTTLRGRALYWSLHPPRGLWRLVPTSLRVPPRPIDDMAAWAIIERVRNLDALGLPR